MDTQRLCHNQTPMNVRCLPMLDPRGRDGLVRIAKVTYEVSLSGVATVPLDPASVRLVEERRGDGKWSSVRLPSDLCAEKPGTDVVLVGTAQPPDASATAMSVSLRV